MLEFFSLTIFIMPDSIRFTSFSIRDGGINGCEVPRPDGRYKEFVVDLQRHDHMRAHADCGNREVDGDSVRCAVSGNKCALHGREIRLGVGTALRGRVFIDNTAGLNQ